MGIEDTLWLYSYHLNTFFYVKGIHTDLICHKGAEKGKCGEVQNYIHQVPLASWRIWDFDILLGVSLLRALVFPPLHF